MEEAASTLSAGSVDVDTEASFWIALEDEGTQNTSIARRIGIRLGVRDKIERPRYF